MQHPIQNEESRRRACLRRLRGGRSRGAAILLAACGVFAGAAELQLCSAQDSSAGRVPVISGGAGYINNVSGGVPTLEPQVNPVLLVPMGPHLLLESRTDFTGFFQRRNGNAGPWGGKIFKTVEFAQLDWLASSRVMASAGKYLLPFGLYNERLQPIWIRNLQDPPLTLPIGTRTSGAGDGLMLRGVAAQTQWLSVEYSAYFSVRSGINQLESARTAGGDASVFFRSQGVEIGTSWQRFLQNREINSSAVYLSWQPPSTGLDVKTEYDSSYFGHGYWAEGAWRMDRMGWPQGVSRMQPVLRMQELWPLHGGGNGLPRSQTRRFDFGLNYYLRDNLRLVSSYGRSFSAAQNANVWNVGATWRFTIPLWRGR